jgi:hypothetical protein
MSQREQEITTESRALLLSTEQGEQGEQPHIYRQRRRAFTAHRVRLHREPYQYSLYESAICRGVGAAHTWEYLQD